jgi:alcohol dehydrogenase
MSGASLIYGIDGHLRWPLGYVLGSRFFPRATEHTSETMTACVFDKHGDAKDVLEMRKVPQPVPTRDQVLIRVVATGVNPVDAKLRANPVPSWYLPKPKITGTDVAGVIISAPAGSKLRAGDRVIAMMPVHGAMWGACAEYAACDERLIARIPDKMPLVEAAALPLVSLTVLQALAPVVRTMRESGAKPAGERILIHAGSGGVGSFAIQYCAHTLGMRVISTCSAANAELVKSLGAERVVDYNAVRFEDAIDARSLVAVLDPLSYIYEKRSLPLLRAGGHYIQIASSPWRALSGDADPLGLAIPEARLERVALGWVRGLVSRTMPRLHGLLWGAPECNYHLVFVHENGAQLAEVARMVERGEVRAVVDRVFPFVEVAAAHERVETGHTRGKVVVLVADEEKVLREVRRGVGK